MKRILSPLLSLLLILPAGASAATSRIPSPGAPKRGDTGRINAPKNAPLPGDQTAGTPAPKLSPSPELELPVVEGAAEAPVTADEPSIPAEASEGSIIEGVQAMLGDDENAEALQTHAYDGAHHMRDAGQPVVIDLGKNRFESTLGDGQRLKIKVMGEEDTKPDDDIKDTDVEIEREYDAVIIGGGVAGLAAALRLMQAGKRVLILERALSPGGLAAYGRTSQTHLMFGRGTAYITKPSGRVARIYRDFGLDPLSQVKIPEPIDSYELEGKRYHHVWSHDTLRRLPGGFRAFKEMLVKLSGKGAFDFNPPETVPSAFSELDAINAHDFLRPYGPELSAFMDSYTQSALGGHLKQLGTMPMLHFYSAEIVPRYTWPGGVGGAAYKMAKKIYDMAKARGESSPFRTRSSVEKVENVEGGTLVTFERGGKQYEVRAKDAIVATPLEVSARIIPEMHNGIKKLINLITYGHYAVHNVTLDSRYIPDTYDLWVAGFGAYPFTDVIDANWMSTHGQTRKQEGKTMLSIYQPMAPNIRTNQTLPRAELNEDVVAQRAARSVQVLKGLVAEVGKDGVLEVESYRWPKSIHVTRPGFLTGVSPALTDPVGAHIHLANNNQGLPAFETAVLMAAEVVDRILGVKNRD